MCAALGRHVRVSGCEDEAEREEFLIEHLGVPVAWIAEAKATKAKREGNHKVQEETQLRQKKKSPTFWCRKCN